MSSKTLTALICGGTGREGSKLARELKANGYWVCVADAKDHRHGERDYANKYMIGDLSDEKFVEILFTRVLGSGKKFDEVHLVIGKNNSLIAQAAKEFGITERIFYSKNKIPAPTNVQPLTPKPYVEMLGGDLELLITDLEKTDDCIEPDTIQVKKTRKTRKKKKVENKNEEV